MATTILRRKADSHSIRRSSEDTTITHRLESNSKEQMIAQRLRLAAQTMGNGLSQHIPLIPIMGIEAREDQERILYSTWSYLEQVTKNLETNPSQPTTRARIIAAARTGKTIVEILLVAYTGLRVTILVPSVTILEKTLKEFREKLPTVPVGGYYGEAKDLVQNGVTVTTYQTFVGHHKKGTLPKSMTHVALVLADEGHETMTDLRQKALSAFDAQTLIIALTATPDYNEERVLSAVYPHLIEEMRLMEAAQKGLLAPGCVRWRLLDIDASEVSLADDQTTPVRDYEGYALGKCMTQAVVFEACLQMRYEEVSKHPTLKDERGEPVLIHHKDLKTMICCASVDMAKELQQFLNANKPKDGKLIGTIFGNTPREQRKTIIQGFKEGYIDTLIQVGTLLQGFDEPSLKLLIDLAPSISIVRGEQKFCRPLTKYKDMVGIIALIYPRTLRPPPILPLAILGRTYVGEDDAESLLSPAPKQQKKAKKPSDPEIPVRSPRPLPKIKRVAVHRQYDMELRPPTLDRQRTEDVRAVLWSCQEFAQSLSSEMEWGMGKLPARAAFAQMLFDHPLFIGFGNMLLRWCHVPPGKKAYLRWLKKQLNMEKQKEEKEHRKVLKQETLLAQPLSDDLWETVDNILTVQKILKLAQDNWRFSRREFYVLQEFLRGETFNEIALKLSVHPATVKNIYRKILEKLRYDLKRDRST